MSNNTTRKAIYVGPEEHFILHFNDKPIVDEQMASVLLKLKKTSFQSHLKFSMSALHSLSSAGITNENDVESAALFIQLASLAKECY
ncbi:MAG: hypothetical protein CVU11_14110 [Bacteroidetes bacterium HGW-Bacteroidetes-6]|jgi:hypothetical protein|nr:MAG: hypothetical protein CVU11_14110 [Bacteroidetes bacterium HGW-Bacteroidetes-6]